MPIERVDPPARGFYGKRLAAAGVVVRAHASVDDGALRVAGERIEALVRGCPRVRDNLAAAGVELHLIGRDQVPSDLPMYRHLRGVPFEGDRTIDQRGRGYGGLHACVDEDSLLGLPTRRHADGRDVCSHELAHAVEAFGLDAALRAAIRARYDAARPRWDGAYAATNPSEFFAELTMWYVGSRGDHGTLADPPPDGPDGLRAHDPESFALLDGLYRGRLVPARFGWDDLAPTRARRSRTGPATEVVVLNDLAGPVEVWWLDHAGEPRPYGSVGPGAIRSLSTYATHVWSLRAGGRELGRYRVGARPARISLR